MCKKSEEVTETFVEDQIDYCSMGCLCHTFTLSNIDFTSPLKNHNRNLF
jgi:hypothetical protein